MKKIAGDIIILHVYQKSQSYDVQFLRIQSETDRIFHHFGPFLPFYLTNNLQNQNFSGEAYDCMLTRPHMC